MRYLLYSILLLFIWSCGDSAPKASIGFQTQNYISLTDDNNHTIVKDIQQRLMFVNSVQGCEALHGDTETILDVADNFCKTLTFYGFSDWRIPTLKEIQNFSKGMDKEKLIPFFTFPQCKRITGLKDDGTLGNINTHNVSPKFEEVPLKLPAGIRCVRDY